MGIEPTTKAWEALVLPLNYARISAAPENDCIRDSALHANETLAHQAVAVNAKWLQFSL